MSTPSKQYQDLMNILNSASEDGMQKVAEEEKVAALEKLAEFGSSFGDGFIARVTPELEKRFEAIMQKTAASFFGKLAAEFMPGPQKGLEELQGGPAPENPGSVTGVATPKEPLAKPVTVAEIPNDKNKTPGMSTKGTAPQFKGIEHMVPAGAQNMNEASTEAAVDAQLDELSLESIKVAMEDPKKAEELQKLAREKVASLSDSEIKMLLKSASEDELESMMEDSYIRSILLKHLR